MTWEELANEISKMGPSQRARPAIFVEPYDVYEIFEVRLKRATEDDFEEYDPIREGDYYLGV